VKSLVSLREPALPDALFRRVLRQVRALGEEGLRGTWQRTFWFPLGARPSNVIEEAIGALNFPVPARATGAEWWLSRMRTSHVGIDFHRDHDIVLAEGGGPVRHPLVSTVLFLNRCTGGLLAVTREPPNPKNPALAPSKHAFDLVTPKPNRLASFDGRLTHGVLDAKNRIPGGRLPREKELRLAVAVNFWAKKPLGARAFAEADVYAALSN
jgi:hypothetical protein